MINYAFQYTLGQSYISRKKQGEFIFLPEHPPNERNVGCEISIKNGKYFVNPLDKVKGQHWQYHL